MGGSVDTRAEEEPEPEGPSGSGRDPARRLALLEGWIGRQVDPPGRAWFRDALAAVARADDPRALARSVALVPRRLGKRDLVLTALDLQEADEVRPGFDPLGLPLDQAARIALLLASYRDPASFAQAIEALCRTADLGEFIAIYRGLALFPAPELLVGRAAEGVRSGIKPVFEAVAHRNPYPAEMFDRSTWNQMVLKALFIGSELAPISASTNGPTRSLRPFSSTTPMSGGRPAGRSVRSSGDVSALLRTSAPSTISKVSSRREPRPNGAPPPSPSPRRTTPKHAPSLAAIRTWRPRSSRAASTGPASAPKVRHESRGIGAAGTEASTGEWPGR
jgi:hypothetical protein